MIALLVTAALGQELGECFDEPAVLSGARYLRALSLDLRGVVPEGADYDRLEAGEVPDALLEEWLDTEAFADQVVRHHRSLLWPNVSDIRLISNRQRLIRDGDVYYRYLVAPMYRGGPVSCGDFEAQYDSEGELVVQVEADGTLREGWVWVEPYWDPSTPVKVCAFGAQEVGISPLGTRCDSYESRYDPYCGCGPGLQWCDTRPLGHVQEDGYQAPVHRSMARDLELRVKRVVTDDLPYTELLTGRTAFVNGPLVHFYKHQLNTPAHVRFNEVPVDPDSLPDLAYTDEHTWVPVELGPEQAGVLTSPAYLMKFQTRRARANRFYNAFLCQPFQPPDDGIEGLDDPEPPLDLTQRSGCDYCHALLEPAGAYWGRWGEYGAGYLGSERFPTFSAECEWCAATGESCSTDCQEYYVVDPLNSEEEPWVGTLKGYQFLEDRHVDHADEGPRLLVNRTVQDGRLPQCVARRTAEWLLGRQVEPHEADWVDGLAKGFTASGFDYGVLVTDIVRSENYRRIR